jgi:alpha,alpha-trehalase
MLYLFNCSLLTIYTMPTRLLIAFCLYCLSLFTACRQEQETHSRQRQSPDEIFGQLFEAVQQKAVFSDSKTFVDCTPLFPPDTIMARYNIQLQRPDFDLKTFVLEHFQLPHQYASGFSSDTSRSVDRHIEALWPVLTRNPDSASQAGSLIPLPFPYIVPGGRFGEVYYWDSYFTMLGLQVAGRMDMVRHMADNFAFLIDSIGFIPNGNRTYYLGRSQPPFFSMIIRLIEESDGKAKAARYLPQLEKEYAFWMQGQGNLSADSPDFRRVVRMPDGTILNRYWDDFPRPRPESHREDVLTAQRSARESKAVFTDLRAGAESGWDFSSRWLLDPQDLATIHTTDFIPVDLNALLFHLESIIADYARHTGDADKANQYKLLADKRKTALMTYCWNENAGFFFDYDFARGQQSTVFSLAAMYPLFFQMADNQQAAACANIIQRDFLKPGGLVTTLLNTGQQWDAPNGWAPLQWISIQGLNHYGHQELANDISRRWIALNEKVYRNTGKMVEKYNVTDLSLDAGGGEYPVQDGFGWSNGVLLKLLSAQ